MTLEQIAVLEALWADANQDTPWQTFEAMDGTEGFIHLCDDEGGPVAWLEADDAGRYNGLLIARVVSALPDLLALARRALEAPDAVAEIAAERRRQVEAENWMPEHDDSHTRGELARAASCYAVVGGMGDVTRDYYRPGHPPRSHATGQGWPWDAGWWKPKDRRRDLIRAGALIVAEIERLDRAAGQVLSDAGESL